MITRCCWCTTPFVKVKWHGAEVWICPKPDCRQRQWDGRMEVRRPKTTPERDGPGMGRPQLIYLPLPRQVEMAEAIAAGRRRILFGGARGGAKSHALRWLHYMRANAVPGLSTLILRKSFPELEMTHIQRAQREVGIFGAEYVASKYEIRYANGSVTKFGHCQTMEDTSKYLSSEWDLMSRDELVTFALQEFSLLNSANRTTKPGMRAQTVDGTNPGGPQAAWVQQWFINKDVDRKEYPSYNPEEYFFIPSLLDDNPYLDKDYEATLLDLPPVLREAYRYGRWDIWPGQYFQEWNRDRHVVDWPGFDPRGMKVLCGIDWGYVAPGAALWAAVTNDHKLYLFDEYTFQSTIASDVAREIYRRSRDWGIKPLYVGDTQMWGPQSDTGESIAETFSRHGVTMVQANKDRKNGWQRVRAYLRDAPDGKPWMAVHPTCEKLIRTLPALQQDEHDPEDVDSEGPDHWCVDGLTVVEMADGSERRIRDVRAGSWVSTGRGRARVRMVSASLAPCLRVDFNNGAFLLGTHDHPVWANGRWMRLDALRYDTMVAWHKTSLGNTATLAPSGDAYTEASPVGTTSTTLTATLPTTPLKTSSVSRVARINSSIIQNGIAAAPSRIWRGFVRWLRHGTDLQRDANIPATCFRSGGARPSQWAIGVNTAAPSTGPGSRWGASSVTPIASRLRVAPLVLTTKTDIVRAALCSESTATASSVSVRAPVVFVTGFREAGITEVWNLLLEGDDHQYITNGLLSHNCDALRYLCMARPMPGQRGGAKQIIVGSVGWLLNREARKDRGGLLRVR